MPGRRLVPLALAFLLTLPALTTRFYASDEIQFFAWLRSAAFDRDADFTNEYTHFYTTSAAAHTPLFHETFLERKNEAGRPPNFAPIGCAILWAPFYAGGHAAVYVLGGVPDGYSKPYIAAVALGSAVYALFAVLLSAAIALRVVGSGSGAALVVLVGTPLLFYMYVAPGFSHACSAFAVSLFLWLWLRARERWTPRAAVLLGLAGALMAMVREQDVFFVAGPALDVLRTLIWPTPRRSITWPAIAAGSVAFAAAYAPQLAAYQLLNGHPGPTEMVARKMTWTSPHVLEVLFSSEHGLFVWTPLALIAVLGLLWLAVRPSTVRVAGVETRDVRWIALLALLMVALQAYVSGCVESWSVAGSFGQRRFVALTPLLVMGLAALATASAARAWRLAAALVAVICIWWNIGLMAQFGLHVMDRQRLTPAANARWTFLELPQRGPALVWRYLTNRSSFYGLPRS